MKKSRGNGGFLPKRKRWIFWCWTCPFWIRGGTRTCSEHSLPTLCCRCFPLLLRTNGKTYGNVRRKASQPQKRRASVSDVPLSRFQKNFRRLSGYGRMEKYHWQTRKNLQNGEIFIPIQSSYRAKIQINFNKKVYFSAL